MNNDNNLNHTIDEEYKKLSDEFNIKFNRKPYIACPSGTKEQTIEAIKICLQKNEDILDELLYPEQDPNILY